MSEPMRDVAREPRGATHNYGLDAIRFAAAVLVLLVHLGHRTWINADYPPALRITSQPMLPPWGNMFEAGWIGVEVFFVLSGYVIAFSAQKATAHSFFAGRLWRLWPSMLICGSITLACYFAFRLKPVVSTLVLYGKSLVFFPFGPWLETVYWTLTIEIAFYGLVFLLVASQKFSLIERLAQAMILFSTLFWLAAAFEPETMAVFFAGRANRLTQLLLLQHGLYFGIGITFWSVQREGLTLMRTLVILFATLGAFLEITHMQLAEIKAGSVLTPFSLWIVLTIMIAASIKWQVQFNRMTQPLHWLFAVLGLATYPLYLIHKTLGGLINHGLYDAGLSPALALTLAGSLSLAAAVLVAVTLEPALRRTMQGSGKKAER